MMNQETPRRSDPTASVSRDAEAVKSTVQHEAADAGRRASGAADALREETGKAYAQARDAALQEAERRREQTASSIDAFAGAIRKAADDLAERDQSLASRFVLEAANGLEGAARSIKSQSVGEIAENVSRFGREHPGTFLAGMVLAGVALGRFAKASAERERDPYARERGSPTRHPEENVNYVRSAPGAHATPSAAGVNPPGPLGE